jgi:hypothetical protein
MAFQELSEARFVRVGEHRVLVRCYDPDTGEAIGLWPSGLAEDTGDPGHFVAASVSRRHRPGQYVPEDNPAAWPLGGPCSDLPAQ